MGVAIFRDHMHAWGQVVPNCSSRSGLGETADGGLYDIFRREFGAPGTPRFEAARRNFIVSEAGCARERPRLIWLRLLAAAGLPAQSLRVVGDGQGLREGTPCHQGLGASQLPRYW